MSIFSNLVSSNLLINPITSFGHFLENIFVTIKLIISAFGTVVILVGALIAMSRYCYHYFANRKIQANLNNIRLDLARNIILGLEFFIASDVIETTIAPDFQALGILGVLVIIRTILNFSLHKEVKELSKIPGSGVSMK